MQLTPSEIERRFKRFIGWGVAGFFVLLAVLIVQSLFCPPPEQDQKVAGERDYSANNNQGDRNPFLLTPQEKARANKSETNRENKENLIARVCKSVCKSEMKLTDLLIGLFTYCTVFVGLFAMRTTDATAKRSERAYLICGGVQGVPLKDPLPVQERLRPKATYFGPEWRMALYNFGRTPAYITKIEWGVVPESEFKREIPVSTVIKERLLPTQSPSFVQEAIPPTGLEPLHYRHVKPGREVGTVFFGRIEYQDVFGETHHSAFALRHMPEHTDTIGDSYTKDQS